MSGAQLGRKGMTVVASLPPVVQAAVASARAAGLRYTTDSRPGIRRTRHGKAPLTIVRSSSVGVVHAAGGADGAQTFTGLERRR